MSDRYGSKGLSSRHGEPGGRRPAWPPSSLTPRGRLSRALARGSHWSAIYSALVLSAGFPKNPVSLFNNSPVAEDVSDRGPALIRNSSNPFLSLQEQTRLVPLHWSHWLRRLSHICWRASVADTWGGVSF